MTAPKTRQEAYRTVQADPLVQEALRIEPRLLAALDRARLQTNEPGYHRIRTYYDLKRMFSGLVGWNAPQPQIRTQHHYRAIVGAVADLLPPDNVDLADCPNALEEWEQAA